MCFFFFKQKTAYEMRISDWSSDVCSSDLVVTLDVPDEGFNAQPVLIKRVEIDPATTEVRFEAETETSSKHAFALGQTTTPPPPVTLTAPDLKPPAPLVGLWDVEGAVKIGRASWRERVCQYV